ncbi:LysR substrate-binding domain-containing protein, partial [Xanthobacter sp. DSM 24535]|uniref:LysR substrate-binding domain-containing protein n=1 Tax=Roseixanthobacter psychrophilus TaxID=3119917 RepID=UPI00372B6038
RPRELADALQIGTVDLAIGPFPDISGAGIHTETLFERGFLCVVAQDHPRLGKGGLTLPAFLQEAHLVVSSPGRTEEVFERFLDEKKLKRRIALSVPHMLCVPAVIAASELIATVPESVGRDFQSYEGLRVIPPPIETPVIRVAQYWIERFAKDPATTWLRAQVRMLFARRAG